MNKIKLLIVDKCEQLHPNIILMNIMMPRLDAIEHEDTLKRVSGMRNDSGKSHVNCGKNIGLKSTILDYRTSADASGDSSSVVAYARVLFH